MKRPAVVFFVVLALALCAAAYGQTPPAYADGSYSLDYVDEELGSVSVQVLVERGRVASVTLPEGKGDVALDDAALADWLKAFVAAPNFMDVDAVSGASQSCDLVKYAVQAALKKAVVK